MRIDRKLKFVLMRSAFYRGVGAYNTAVKRLPMCEHSGQMSAHVRGLTTSGLFPEHTTERTVREFVNEILLGIFSWWMNHYLNDLPRMIPRMTEDLCGSKRKKGDPV